MFKYKIIIYGADAGPDETSITIAGFCVRGDDLAAIACTAVDLLTSSASALAVANSEEDRSDAEPGPQEKH